MKGDSFMAPMADVFRIDAEKVTEKLVTFIRKKTDELRRDGCVTALSGGLDSSTVAALCVRAVGAGKVTGLFLPEKHGATEAEKFARLCAREFGFALKTIDISKILKKLGTYDFILSRLPTNALREKLVKTFLQGKSRHPFVEGAINRPAPLVRLGTAAYYSKHRIRLVVTYKYAEEHNLLVAGSAHKSEDLVGLFSKHGVDDNADVMPLKSLYRAHVLQIARYLGVPQAIWSRAPNPEMIPGIDDKYKDILGIESEQLDLLLYSLEANLPIQEISEKINLPLEKVEEIKLLVKSTEHMRNHSMYPLVLEEKGKGFYPILKEGKS
jgi:NAD+ synthase